VAILSTVHVCTFSPTHSQSSICFVKCLERDPCTESAISTAYLGHLCLPSLSLSKHSTVKAQTQTTEVFTRMCVAVRCKVITLADGLCGLVARVHALTSFQGTVFIKAYFWGVLLVIHRFLGIISRCRSSRK